MRTSLVKKDNKTEPTFPLHLPVISDWYSCLTLIVRTYIHFVFHASSKPWISPLLTWSGFDVVLKPRRFGLTFCIFFFLFFLPFASSDSGDPSSITADIPPMDDICWPCCWWKWNKNYLVIRLLKLKHSLCKWIYPRACWKTRTSSYQVIPSHGNPQMRWTLFDGYLFKYCSVKYQTFHQVSVNTSQKTHSYKKPPEKLSRCLHEP